MHALSESESETHVPFERERVREREREREKERERERDGYLYPSFAPIFVLSHVSRPLSPFQHPLACLGRHRHVPWVLAVPPYAVYVLNILTWFAVT